MEEMFFHKTVHNFNMHLKNLENQQERCLCGKGKLLENISFQS